MTLIEVWIYTLAGIFTLLMAFVTILAVLGKGTGAAQRQDTPEMTALRARLDAWSNQRSREMALRMAGTSWGFALGVMVAALTKRRRSSEELSHVVPTSGDGPHQPLQPTRAAEPNEKPESAGIGPRG